ncbi:MAG: pilus assembly FimT family protein [Terrimicrobiaceae bacterium]
MRAASTSPTFTSWNEAGKALVSPEKMSILKTFAQIKRGFSLIEILAVILIAGILAVGGYPKLTNFFWEIKLEQEARMVYQDLQLFMTATVTAGPSEGPIPRRGLGIFENASYGSNGKRVRRYSLVDPLNLLAAASRGSRDIANDGFCIICTDSTNQPFGDDSIEICVTSDGKISSPTTPLTLQVKAFDKISGETDDSDAWNILIDPIENRIRLRRQNAGYL